MNFSKTGLKTYKFIIPISMIYLIFYIASYPIAYKIVKVGPIIETGAIFLFPFCYTLGDIVSEVYGYKLSRQMVWLSIISGFLFNAIIIAVLYMPSPTFWHHQKEYENVLDPMFKVFFAMTAATITGSFINLFLIAKWKIHLRGRLFWLRSIGSTSLGELFFSILAGLITFLGVVPPSKLFWLIFNGWVFKVAYATIMSAPATIIVRYLKRAEGVDVYDYGTNFNPFKLQINNSAKD